MRDPLGVVCCCFVIILSLRRVDRLVFSCDLVFDLLSSCYLVVAVLFLFLVLCGIEPFGIEREFSCGE